MCRPLLPRDWTEAYQVMTPQENGCGFSDTDLETSFGFLTHEERRGVCPYLETKVFPAKAVLMEDNDLESRISACPPLATASCPASGSGLHLTSH